MRGKLCFSRLCIILIIGCQLIAYSQNSEQKGSEWQSISLLTFTLNVRSDGESNTQMVRLGTNFIAYKVQTMLTLYSCTSSDFDDPQEICINPQRSQPMYAWEYGNKQHVSFYHNSGGNILASPISPATNTFMAGDFAENNNAYFAIDHDVDSLLTVDINTGQETLVAQIQSPYLGKKITGMAYDHSAKVMYVVSTDSVRNSWLYTIDLNNGNLSLVGAIGFASIANLGDVPKEAPQRAGLYGIDVNTDQLIKISKATGQGTVVGNIQADAAGLMHGMDYDKTRHKMYATITQPGKTYAEVGEVNINSGAIQNLKRVGNATHLSYATVRPFEEPRERTVCIPPPDPIETVCDSGKYTQWINKRDADSGNPLDLYIDVRQTLGNEVNNDGKPRYYQLRVDRRARTDEHGWFNKEWVYWGTINITIQKASDGG